MAYPQQLLTIARPAGRNGMLYVILILWGLVAISVGSLLVSQYAFQDRSSKFYLFPWCLATGVVIAAPSVYLFYKKRFDPFHPLVFAAWSYFFPGFFLGGLMLTVGLSEPYFLSYVQDEQYDLPLTFIYIMLGYAGLTLGFALGWARRFGSWVGNRLPTWEMQTSTVPFAAIVLLILGMANTIIAFAQGLLGFQRVQSIASYDGILFLLSLFLLEAIFLLWLYIFRSQRLGFGQLLIIALILFTSFTRSAFQGNRGSLVGLLLLIAFAFAYSGRKLTSRYYAVGSVLLVVAMVAGMIYGTTFRSVKGSEEQVDLGQYAAVVGATFDKLAEQDVGTILTNGFSALAERLDSVSSLAVVVSNYEALAPYEESWGINNNIYVDTITFFIPRVVWPDKPISIEPGKYADLYFNYSENSFTMTPMGDLLRNFGPWGVPLGMIILGMLIRVIYAVFMENRPFSFWRATVFFMVLTTISYEGTYGLIIPYMFKIGVTAFLGILVVVFFAGAGRRVRSMVKSRTS
jgi:hypothetical protein